MSEIQAVYALTTDGWNASALRQWLTHEGLTPIKRAHRLGTEIRYRITPPGHYARFTTKVLPNGVHLVLGYFR